MTKQETYDHLRKQGVSFGVTEHPAVFNMEECAELDLPYPEDDAKNLLVRDDKRRDYYLITVKGSKRVNLKEFRKQEGTRPLTFASPEELLELMGLTPGSVTPLGLLSDKERKIHFYLDEEFTVGSGQIGVHPNDNTATVWLHTEDLLRLIREHGNTVNLTQISGS